MEFQVFIKKLHIKNAWMTKAEFTQNLFLNSVNDSSTIIDKRKSLPVFKGYNRGNPIDEIANDVLCDLNEEGIRKFLEDTFDSNPDKKAEYVQTICTKFKDDIPDISPDNICQKITDFFINDVLGSVCRVVNSDDNNTNETESEFDKRNPLNIPDNTSTDSEVTPSTSNPPSSPYASETIACNKLNNKIKARHAEKIEDTIEKLEGLCRDMIYGYESDYKKQSFQEKYSQYIKLNAQLAGYAEIYPFLESLSKIPQSILKERDFYWLDEEQPLLKNHRSYMKLLLNLRKELNKTEEV